MKQEPVPVQGAWLRRVGRNVQLLLELDGQWRLVCEQPIDSNFSYISEPAGILSAPLDPVLEFRK